MMNQQLGQSGAIFKAINQTRWLNLATKHLAKLSRTAVTVFAHKAGVEGIPMPRTYRGADPILPA
jgi:hypothetical protein